jgi:hypothetical protein
MPLALIIAKPLHSLATSVAGGESGKLLGALTRQEETPRNERRRKKPAIARSSVYLE